MRDTRRYDSDSRTKAAQRTRHAVVVSAAELFESQGYRGTTMRSIAERAGVSVETVNALGPKVQLLRAAFEHQFLRSAAEELVLGAPTAQIDISDPVSVRSVLRPLVRQFERSVGMHNALRAAADVDDDAKQLVEQLRHGQRRQIYGLVEQQVPACATAAKRKVADSLAYALSHEAYEHFVRACGWAPSNYEEWAAEFVVNQLRKLWQRAICQ